MRYIDPNSFSPKKSKENINVGDIFLTFNGYMKVSCLRALTLVSVIPGRQR